MLTYIAVLLDLRNKLEVLGYVIDDIFGEGVEEKSKFVIDNAISLLMNIRPNMKLLIKKK